MVFTQASGKGDCNRGRPGTLELRLREKEAGKGEKRVLSGFGRKTFGGILKGEGGIYLRQG